MLNINKRNQQYGFKLAQDTLARSRDNLPFNALEITDYQFGHCFEYKLITSI